jgi:hypothetical protein
LDYIIDQCLSMVKVRKDGVWSKATTPLPGGGQAIMHREISDDMVAMMTIVYFVLKENLSGFFDALPSDFQEKLAGAMSAT